MALIKELREKSGAPISDSCLASSGWALDAAYDALRKKGLAAAAKSASRHAADGLVGLALAGSEKAAVVEVNSETDFVGRSALFRQLVGEGARAALRLDGAAGGAAREATGDELAALPVPSPSSYSDDAEAAGPGSGGGDAAPLVPLPDACAEVAAKVRENIKLRRGFVLAAAPGGVVGGYVHMAAGPGLGRIASVVALAAPGGAPLQQDQAAAAAQLATNLAMHVAGLRPQYIDLSAVPETVLEAERQLLLEQAAGSGKPQAVLDKMVAGRLTKWAQEMCLLDQRYLLDDALTVRQLLQQQGAGKQGGGGVGGGALEVTGFLRVQVGEGLEAAEGAKDFAAEVAEMAGGRS
ncbi:Elongation factor Ts [Monoraphidium neglectum]|uniref:Elongation factor Ts, mitochondrial n=1 Tax=Monoraphidium neglectum TaxID=145388 RepID=A0A0D2N395_9CHLO|nr:Elongation factor Ts [Monoraphidium neglectum]KIZ06862.1 Elongation factor Ts [Monoraphidium neglectum]|eukprot:XP_013905881.1 Elongation factor Ts [Monoraphidium neglectum]